MHAAQLEPPIRQPDPGLTWSSGKRYLSHYRPDPLPPGVLAAVAEQARPMLLALFPPGSPIEFRTIPRDDTGQARSRYATGVDDALIEELTRANRGGWHVCFGVNPRREPGAKGDAGVAQARALFVDCDHVGVDEALARIAAAGLPEPSIVVGSGHGCHCYWLLTEPIADLASWSDLEKDLAARLGSDPKVCNAERVMRLPGTTNHKADPVPCRLIECHSERRYAWADLRMRVPVVMVPSAEAPPGPPAPESIANIDGPERYRRYIAFMAKLPPAVSGERGHDATLRAACEIVRHGIPQDGPYPMALMRLFNERCTPRWSDAELAHKIRDAYAKSAHEFGVRLVDDGRRATLEDRAQLRNDTGNGARFALQHGHNVRYNAHRKQWLFWSGKYWEPVVVQIILELAKRTALGIFDEVKAESDSRIREELSKHANASLRVDKLDAMMRAAQSDLLIRPEELDADPNVLNVQNGIVELRTGELRPHNRKAYCTKICNGSYLPGAPVVRFRQFLERTFRSKPGLIPFTQKMLGYTATGKITEQVLFLPYGPGENGKSTLFLAVAHAFGEYAAEAAEHILTARKDTSHPAELADLEGARLVIVAETKEGERFNTSRLKALTGEEFYKVRGMHENFRRMRLTQKFIVYTNRLPRVSDRSRGFWRRVRILPFMETILPHEKDMELPAKLKAEADGILTWIIAGAVRWAKEGLGNPPEVEEATEAYKKETDTIGLFVSDLCEDVPKDREGFPFKLIYDTYTQWCRENEEDKESRKAFGIYLQDKGYKPSDGGERLYFGIRLKPDRRGGITYP
jgi:putative DNA primase/helicase